MSPGRWRILQRARRKALSWLRRQDVVGVGIGLRLRRGQWSRTTCIVVKVKWKLEHTHLKKLRRSRFPRWIEVRDGKRRVRVGVDVQETRGETKGTHQGLVGGRIAEPSNAGTIGSVSAVVDAAGTLRLLISGHVARASGRRLRLAGLGGVTESPIRDDRLDHCIVKSDTLLSSTDADLIDTNSLNGVADVASLTLGDPLFFTRAQSGARVATVLRHIDMSAPFPFPGGSQMNGLLATDGNTVSGDSGAMLYDASFRAVGTLVGIFGGESYFISCDYALNALGLVLA